MNDDGYSDTTDSSPPTVRRVIPRVQQQQTSESNTTTSPQDYSEASMSSEEEPNKTLSSKDFIPKRSTSQDQMEAGKNVSPTKGIPGISGTKPGAEHDEEDDEEYEELNTLKIEGLYNPEDYTKLSVTPEIKELFGYISQYQLPPLSAINDVKLHPFIPDYYPSVGDIDAFIKVTEPGVKVDTGLGIKSLDEPAPFQSDPSVLDLRLRALAKQSSAKTVVVKKVDNLGKNSKVIENWIKDISDLHRSKPSPSVHYSKPMPDIDSLLQEWPPEVEEMLKDLQLPGPDLNCDLGPFVDLVCSIVDIPVYKSRIQSLHVLFTLYTTMKQFSSQYSRNVGGKPEDDFMPSASSLRISGDGGGGGRGGVDHLRIS